MQRLGQHPHADRKFAPAQSQHEVGNRDREQRRADRAGEQGGIGGKAAGGQTDGEIGADAEERLLADGHKAGVAGQRVPHRRENDIDEKRRQLVDDIGAGDHRRRRQRDENDGDDDAEGSRLARPALDEEPGFLAHRPSPSEAR